MGLIHSRNIGVFFREGILPFCFNPVGTLRFLRDHVSKDHKLETLCNPCSHGMRLPRNEFAARTRELGAYVESRVAPYARSQTIGNLSLHSLGAPLVYEICRLLRPRVVVETGVASGVSTTYVLQALEDNDQGMLYSIDYPNVDVRLPENRTVGWLVPELLRKRWRLIVGKSEDVLLPLLKSLSTVDLFLHDSGHSYSNMIFEFKTVWPFIKKQGVLLSDDILANKALHDFAGGVGRSSMTFGNMGAIHK